MEPETPWLARVRLFRLEGHAFDLQDLAELFSTGARTITRRDENYYLSVEMQDGLDDEQALAIAQDELATINGLALVQVRKYQPVGVSGVSVVDPTTGKIRTTIFLATGTAAERSRAFAPGISLGPDGKELVPSVLQESPGHTILNLAASIDALQRALFLYGKVDHNWRGLYMVLEAIEDGNGGESSLVKKSWGGEGVKQFKATCNSYKALGPDARHGSTRQGVDVPNLTLADARQLIRGLLSGWIAELRRPTKGTPSL